MLIYPDLPLSLMSINKDTIKKISKLARISVTNDETDRLEKDLNSILKFVEQLKELNTDKVEPISSVSDQDLTMNKDEVKKINEKDDILKNAPEKNSNYYVVPKVIE
jgi:aspartyl-tRNA(Asn)/glutamyl-tRNA(Gln) amidotransferase subunit C